VTLGLFKQSRSRVTIYALDVLCAQLTRDLFATAKLLLKVLLQKGTWSFPGQSLTDDSRTRRFPDIRFADKTFPGQYVFQAPFLPRDALHKRGLCRRVVSVRPSVRPPRSCILSKRTNVSYNFSPSGSHHSRFSIPNVMAIFRLESPLPL